MAKHKHKNSDFTQENNKDNNVKNFNNNPFGIDPFQLINLLGGKFDMNSIGNILASMNTNGFNFGNLDPLSKMSGLNFNHNMNNMVNGNANNNMQNNMTHNMNEKQVNDIEEIDLKPKQDKKESKKSSRKGNVKNIEEDENLLFLQQLRNYIHPEKAEFVDKIIKMYLDGKFND